MDIDIQEDEAPMYLEAGRALLEAQNLELHLSNLIVIHQMLRGELKSDSGIRKAFNKHDRKTLGRLLKDVREYVDIDPDFQDKLKRALDARNLLVHRFFGECLAKYGYSEGKVKGIKDLRNIYKILNEVSSQLILINFVFTKKTGLTLELINDELKKIGADFSIDWPSNPRST